MTSKGPEAFSLRHAIHQCAVMKFQPGQESVTIETNFWFITWDTKGMLGWCSNMAVVVPVEETGITHFLKSCCVLSYYFKYFIISVTMKVSLCFNWHIDRTESNWGFCVVYFDPASFSARFAQFIRYLSIIPVLNVKIFFKVPSYSPRVF